VRRSVPIRADAGATLLGQPFASDTLSTGAVRELFTFTDQDMQTVPTGPGEEFVYLAVKAKDDLGADIPVNGPQPKRVRKLTDVAQTVTRYNSPGSRDSGVCLGTTWPCRGDAWARPAFHQIMATAQQALSLAVPNGRSAYPIEFDDFSNINAGYYPPHNFHNEGRHVDGQIDGYATKDAALAIKMVEVAREIHTAMTAAGTTFTAFQILVEFNKSNPADPFRVELMNHTIGGKPALDYFVNGGKLHRSHFHVQMY
jgi:hypothetical protein